MFQNLSMPPLVFLKNKNKLMKKINFSNCFTKQDPTQLPSGKIKKLLLKNKGDKMKINLSTKYCNGILYIAHQCCKSTFK